MNTKEAAEKFKIDVREVRKRKKDGMILEVRMVKGRIFIPDDTEIIPSKQDIQAFLLEILKYKNNPNITVSRKLCPDEKSLKTVVNYIYKRGFVGEFKFKTNIRDLFQNLNLTDEGLAYVIGASRLNQITKCSINPITINPITISPKLNIGLMNIG